MRVSGNDSIYSNYLSNAFSNGAVNRKNGNNQTSGGDIVSLSSGGKEMSRNRLKNTAFSSAMLDKAEKNPEIAEELARNYAYSRDLLAFDIPENMKMSDTYYRDGTSILDTSYKIQFENEADQYRQERIELYESEKAMGTSDSDILKKIFAYYDDLPSSYQLKIGYI